MKKILFDLMATQSSGDTKFHGGSEYSKTIFYSLLKKNNTFKIEVLLKKNREMTDKILLDICERSGIKINFIESTEALQVLLEKELFCVFFLASSIKSMYKLKVPLKTKFIFVLHDLRPFEVSKDKYDYKYPNKFSLQGKIRRLLPPVIGKKILAYVYKKDLYQFLPNKNTNSAIVTVSYHSKYSILLHTPIESGKIHVFYSPPKVIKEFEDNDLYIKKLNIKSKEYFLLISANRPHKNNYRAVIAFDELIAANQLAEKYKILVLGGAKQIYNEIKNKENFIFEDYVSTEELEVLYKNAYAFIYPTLCEGFGYPPLEAMKHGTLVAASAISSVPEVCGNAALYFNPYSIDEIKNRILQLLDNNVANEYKSRLKLRYEIIEKKQKDMLEELLNFILS